MLAIDEKEVKGTGHIVYPAKPTANGKGYASAKSTNGLTEAKSLDKKTGVKRPFDSLTQINSLNEVKNNKHIDSRAAASIQPPTRSPKDLVLEQNPADLDDEVSEGDFVAINFKLD